MIDQCETANFNLKWLAAQKAELAFSGNHRLMTLLAARVKRSYPDGIVLAPGKVIPILGMTCG